MILNLLNLDGQFPQHIELSPNPCTQGCEYCYAKIWKRKFFSADKILNEIIKYTDKKEGLLPFYLRKKEPIAISNRTDIVSHPEWYNILKGIKKLGFPLYIQTKGNKDFIKTLDFMDEKDTVYITITGDDKYEEKNLINQKEKIQLAKKLKQNGIYINVAFNPWMSEKITVEKAESIVIDIKPDGVIARPYHDPKQKRTAIFRDARNQFTMKEDKTGKTKTELLLFADIMLKNKIPFDVDHTFRDLKYFKDSTLVYKHIDNQRRFGGNCILAENELIYMAKKENQYKKEGLDAVFLTYDEFIKTNQKTLRYHDGAIVTADDICHKIYKFNPSKKYYSYIEYLSIMWENNKLFGTSHYILDNDKDDMGKSILYFVLKENKNE